MTSTNHENELFPLHKVHDSRQDIINQCCDILNFEWPRSETIRIRSLTSSCEELPTCLALVHWFSSGPSVLGHAKVAYIPSNERGVWIESVVIHPDLRGKGWGKYLMLKVEEYCVNKLGANAAYLCTIDKQPFYSRIGYTFCDPVISYGGNMRLIQNLAPLNNSPINRKPVNFSRESHALEPSPIHAIKDVIERQIDSISNHKYSDIDIAKTCAQNFSHPKLTSPPKLDAPPRRLPSGSKSLSVLSKETRICLNRDYMKKRISTR
ncbi:uncharacterized protein Naa80 [Lepeophtheirus salmonis]|uniref:uncharacterized protein Naa80 n=1 Tax=Lepeophtheirus salmonis TaxID=72036 RepID=UPI001AE138BD|nr:N-alpha-acetyltransferase 80-like [Lepeophtheirus salmonis]